MRIIQILPTLSFGDGVGNDAIAMDRALCGGGFETFLAADGISGREKLSREGARILTFDQMMAEDPPRPDDLVIYHLSVGSRLNAIVPALNCRKMYIYHNITPPEFFSRFDPAGEKLCRDGLREAAAIAPYAEYCLADSAFNREDLRKMGYFCPIDVLPIIIPYSDYQRTPDPSIVEQYSGDGYTNVLFVGRLAPNKKQEDVIRAFRVYQEKYNAKSRLFLVGNTDNEGYVSYLKTVIPECGAENVIFSGHISFEGILAYYQISHLFLCLSEHEGFCIPLIEAMMFHLPILAYRSTAVPDTLGEGGVLLDDKSPESVGKKIFDVLEDREQLEKMAQGQQEQLRRFEPSHVKEQFLADVQKFIDEGEKTGQPGGEAPGGAGSLRSLYELFCRNLREQAGIREQEMMPFDLLQASLASDRMVVNIGDLLKETDKETFVIRAYWSLLGRLPEDRVLEQAKENAQDPASFQKDTVRGILSSPEFAGRDVICVNNPWKDEPESRKAKFVRWLYSVYKRMPEGIQHAAQKMYVRVRGRGA